MSGAHRPAAVVLAAIVLTLVGCSSGSAKHTTSRTTPPTTTATASTTTTRSGSSATTGTSGPASSTSVPPAGSFARFVGEWGGHGRGLTVRGDGTGVATWRVYRFCSGETTPPCDTINGNDIVYGGNAPFALSSASGEAARGTVTSSTDPATLPKGPVTLTLQPGGTLEVAPSGMVFCGPGSSPGACGA